MKKILIGLLALGTFSAFAGTLVNAKTGEEIEFNLNKETNIVEISGSYVGNIRVETMTPDDKAYYTLTDWLVDDETLVVLSLGTVYVAGVVADTVAAPFVAMKNATNKKDYKTLMSALYSDRVLGIKNKKFNRILNYLLQFR